MFMQAMTACVGIVQFQMQTGSQPTASHTDGTPMKQPTTQALKYPLIIEAVDLISAIDGGDPTLKVLDLRPVNLDAGTHIPGARRIDPTLLNRVSAPHAGLLPDQAGIDALVQSADLRVDDHIVAVDAGGVTAAARLVWVLQAWGFNNTSWLNGGMKAWFASGGKVVSDAAASAPVLDGEGPASEPDRPVFQPTRTASNCVTADELAAELDDPTLRILDVRSAAEFAGTDVRSAEGGHVPGARHLEWTQQLEGNGTLKPADQLRAELERLDVLPEHRVVAYCQSHQRSAVTWLILRSLGYDDVRGLDGAWSVWGNRAELPKER